MDLLAPGKEPARGGVPLPRRGLAVAIEFARVHILSRSQGHSAVAAAAYRAGERLTDKRTGETFDYRERQAAVVHAQVLLPAGANTVLTNRGLFWNAVEAAEQGSTREATAQIAKDHVLALPRELGKEHHIRLAKAFAQDYLVDRGVPVDVTVHYHSAGNPHAHLLAATRTLDQAGFGKKARDLNGHFWGGCKIPDEERLKDHWADFQDRYFQDYGLDLKVARHAGQYQTQAHLGPAQAMEAKGIRTALGDYNRQAKAENRARIQQHPDLIIAAVAERYAVFTRWDLHRELARQVEEAELYQHLLTRIENSPTLIRMPTDAPNGPFFTTRATLAREVRLSVNASTLQARPHTVSEHTLQRLLKQHADFSADQQTALRHVLTGSQIAVVEGLAGTGKSTLLRVARAGWEAAGYRVMGVAPTGKAARGLEAAGMPSRTLHTFFRQLDKGHSELRRGDVVVTGEAARVDSRTLEWLVTAVVEAGAKLVLVGDSEPLPPVQAGGAYRLIRDQVGYANLTTVRQQHHAWQRQASLALARGDTDQAVAAYLAQGHLHFAASSEAAQTALVDDYLAHPATGSAMVLAHRRPDVQALNAAIRTALKRLGRLGSEVPFQTETGALAVAVGERVLFTKNNRALGVSNGDLGSVEDARPGRLTVRLEGAREQCLTFREDEYRHLAYGYAMTLHQSQGLTTERVYVLASRTLNKHLTAVALTRHREDVQVYASQEDFPNEQDLVRCLTHAERQITALEFAHRHGHEVSELLTLKADWEMTLAAMSAQHSVFTLPALEKELAPFANAAEQLAAIRQSGQLVSLPSDPAGEVYYTTRQTLEREAEMLRFTAMLKNQTHTVSGLEAVLTEHPWLSREQRRAVQGVTQGSQMAVVEGLAGTGKSMMLKAARAAWEAEGFRVVGLAPTGKAARGLEESAGLWSETIHRFLNRLECDATPLRRGDVVVLDEAGLVDSRLLHAVLKAVTKADAKLVLVGDSEQLQPLQAGGAYTLIREAAGHVELTIVHRQQSEWQRKATGELARGEVRQALLRYHQHRHIHVLNTTDAAKASLVRAYLASRAQGSVIALAHRHRDVADLNAAIRAQLKQHGVLGPVATFNTPSGPLEVAPGERVIFRQNDATLALQNGALGTVTAARPGELEVRLDDSQRTVTVRDAEYRHLAHGYAMTIHQSQGVTADRVGVLATRTLDKHLTYVALTRHRQAVDVFGGRDQFKSSRHFIATLSRPRRKLTATAFAARHGLDVEKLAVPAESVLGVTPAPQGVAAHPVAPSPVPVSSPPERPPVTPAEVLAAIERGDPGALRSLPHLGRAALKDLERLAADIARYPHRSLEDLLQERPAYHAAQGAYRIAAANHDSAVTQRQRFEREHPVAARLALLGLGQGAGYYRRERETEAALKTAKAALQQQEAINRSAARRQQAASRRAPLAAPQAAAEVVLAKVGKALEAHARVAQHRAQRIAATDLDLEADDEAEIDA